MGKPKGSPKTGGRKARTPNRDSIGVSNLLENMGVEPIVEMVKIAQNEALEPGLRFNAWKELAQYKHSKRKAIEARASTEDGQVSRAQLDNLLGQARELAGRINA